MNAPPYDAATTTQLLSGELISCLLRLVASAEAERAGVVVGRATVRALGLGQVKFEATISIDQQVVRILTNELGPGGVRLLVEKQVGFAPGVLAAAVGL